jgi:transcriptional regulator with XRE-family HTH domain
MELGMASKRDDKDPERGARLKAHRERLGLTQRQVSERIGKVQEVVSRHERGGGMDTDTLLGYAQLYGVTADSLAGDSAQMPAAAVPAPQPANAIPLSLARFLTDGRCNPLSDAELQHMIRHIAEGNSADLDDLEIHLLSHRAERDKTDAALDAFRAAVRRVRKQRGQGPGGVIIVEGESDKMIVGGLPAGKSKKPARRTESTR